MAAAAIEPARNWPGVRSDPAWISQSAGETWVAEVRRTSKRGPFPVR